ncbi:MAG TPA: hypothetical protein P5248_05565, partial [Bacteroidales bacterium]|nr:hypothetical protein [Bacteroidales bacterium]
MPRTTLPPPSPLPCHSAPWYRRGGDMFYVLYSVFNVLFFPVPEQDGASIRVEGGSVFHVRSSIFFFLLLTSPAFSQTGPPPSEYTAIFQHNLPEILSVGKKISGSAEQALDTAF